MQIVCDPQGPRFHAEDLSSTHGVLVNGVRLSGGRVDLFEVDCISAGRIDPLFTMRDIQNRDQAFDVLESQQGELATINFYASADQDLGGNPAEAARRRILRFTIPR